MLAQRENSRYSSFSLGAFEINYLDKRAPWLAAVWSMGIPSVGQLYLHRIILAFFILVNTIVLIAKSNLLLALHGLVLGDLKSANAAVDPQWLLYIPSFYFFTVYDAYANAVENNKFKDEQRDFLLRRYQPAGTIIAAGSKVESCRSWPRSSIPCFWKWRFRAGGQRDPGNLCVALGFPEKPGQADGQPSSGGRRFIRGQRLYPGFHVQYPRSQPRLRMGLGTDNLGMDRRGFRIPAGRADQRGVFYAKNRKLKRRKSRGQKSEVILIVTCEERQSAMAEEILWEHDALGMAKTK